MDNTANALPRDDAFFHVDISGRFGKDAAYAINDVVRMLCIQTTVQALLYLNDPNCVSFWSVEFVLLSMYVTMGVLVFWLLLRRIVKWH
jgi:hypothetical protein